MSKTTAVYTSKEYRKLVIKYGMSTAVVTIIGELVHVHRIQLLDERTVCEERTVSSHCGPQVTFHSHLNIMEESLNATQREKNEVESLTRQLETGRTKATLNLQARITNA